MDRGGLKCGVAALTEIRVFFDRKNRKYVTDTPCKCIFCDCDLLVSYTLRTRFIGGNVIRAPICMGCYYNVRHDQRKNDIIRAINPVSKISRDSIPVLDVEPAPLIATGHTLQEAAALPSQKTIERTKYAGRESIEGARVGADISKQLEAQDIGLAPQDAAKLLLSLKRADTELIEEQVVTQIEAKK